MRRKKQQQQQQQARRTNATNSHFADNTTRHIGHITPQEEEGGAEIVYASRGRGVQCVFVCELS